MDRENALLFAQATEACDIVRLLLKVINESSEVSPDAYQIKEFDTETGKSLPTYHPSLVAHGSHIDIGYYLKLQKQSKTENPVLWIGLRLHSCKPPNIYAWLDETYRDPKFTVPPEGMHYGPLEDEDCPIGDGFWLPLKLCERNELFNPDTIYSKRKSIIKGFLECVQPSP
jgi:hypothetical protein